jgi:hypothetical protein
MVEVTSNNFFHRTSSFVHKKGFPSDSGSCKDRKPSHPRLSIHAVKIEMCLGRQTLLLCKSIDGDHLSLTLALLLYPLYAHQEDQDPDS